MQLNLREGDPWEDIIPLDRPQVQVPAVYLSTLRRVAYRSPAFLAAAGQYLQPQKGKVFSLRHTIRHDRRNSVLGGKTILAREPVTHFCQRLHLGRGHQTELWEFAVLLERLSERDDFASHLSWNPDEPNYFLMFGGVVSAIVAMGIPETSIEIGYEELGQCILTPESRLYLPR